MEEKKYQVFPPGLFCRDVSQDTGAEHLRFVRDMLSKAINHKTKGKLYFFMCYLSLHLYAETPGQYPVDSWDICNLLLAAYFRSSSNVCDICFL